MGYYINEDSKGNSLGRTFQDKATNLVLDGAVKTDGQKFEENLICVVDNGPFAAAGYCYDENEYRVFSHPDPRPKIWLVHPKAKELSNYK